MKITPTQSISSWNYVGTVEESTAVSLSFSLTGMVEEVYVSEGQQVKKGQLLAKLNTASVENAHKIALAKLQQAQDAYDRLVKVHQGGSLPDIKFVEVETGLQQAKSMEQIARKNVEDCKLYAPRSGIIAERKIEVGANVLPSIPAFKLVSVEKVLVKIPIPENEISMVSTGQKAVVEVPALNNAVFNGKIEMKGVVANSISHTYEVKISIDNPQSQLLPGMVCKVFLTEEKESAKIVVPNGVVQISPDGRHFVWLAKGDTAQRHFIETAGLSGNGVVVSNSLSENDLIIVEGFHKISEGMKISYQLPVEN